MYNGSAAPELQTSATVSVNTWTHLAACRSGSTTTVYINGVSAGTLSGSQSIQSNGNLYLGNRGDEGTPWLGNIDEIRISNVARYSGNFTNFGQDGGTITSPTAFTADANTILLVHGEAQAATGKITRIHGTSLAWK